MKTVAIHQPQYLPYLGFFHKIKRCDYFVALDDAQFEKSSMHNRNRIKTAQGWQWLTVPVLHNFGEPIREAKINATTCWQHKQLRTLKTNYAKAPHFAPLFAELQIILERDWVWLCELNMELTRWIMRQLAIETPILYSSELSITGTRTERLVQICQSLGADCYLSGPGGKDYMDLNLFQAAQIQVTWQNFTPPEYPQVFPSVGFIPSLSVIDALFSCGADASRFVS